MSVMEHFMLVIVGVYWFKNNMSKSVSYVHFQTLRVNLQDKDYLFTKSNKYPFTSLRISPIYIDLLSSTAVQ